MILHLTVQGIGIIFGKTMLVWVEEVVTRIQ